MAVDTPCDGYEMMKEDGDWEMLGTVYGGTKAMRKAGTNYLPQEEDESDQKYRVRLGRSFLYNAYKDTITKCVSRPFSKPMTIEVPEQLWPLIENFDGEGQHLQDFAMEYFKELVKWGVAHAFADYPKVDDPNGENKKTIAEKGFLPFNRIIATRKMIGWIICQKKANEKVLKEIRYCQSRTEDMADWEQETIDQIWVVRENEYYVYEKKKEEKTGKETWEIVEFGNVAKGFDGIPLVTAYTEKVDMMIAMPPLQELGWANVEHWQSLSDQKNILRFSRFGILMASGFNADEIKKGLTVSPTQVVYSENPDANLRYTEHTGKAIDAGNKDIQSIEDRMEVLGLQPMLQKYWNVKATTHSINETKSVSQIEMWIASTIRAIKQLLVLDGKWMGLNLTEDDIKVDISKDFVFGQADSADISALHKARELGDIDQKTYLMELKRFGVLSDDVDVDDTIKMSKTEDPNVPGFTAGTEVEEGQTEEEPSLSPEAEAFLAGANENL